jgi:hypothetical protein
MFLRSSRYQVRSSCAVGGRLSYVARWPLAKASSLVPA